MGVNVRQKPAGSGVYWVFINHDNKRKAKKIGRDKKLAQEVARKIEARLVLGDLGFQNEDKAPKLAVYAATWIKTTVPATCKPSTVTDYRGILKNHILPVFGKYPVTEIKRLMVKNFLMEKSNQGYGSSTVTHIKNVISGVLNLALDDEVIQTNPAQRLGRVIKAKPLRLKEEPLNREELALLLGVFEEYYPRYYPFVLTLARTGMRLGEALALEWGDIDFHGRFINIRRGFSRGRIQTPKAGKARRVDMSLQLTDCLKALRHERKKETMKNGWGDVPELIFLTENGTRIIDTNFRARVFKRVLEKAGLRKIRIHDLRHSYASQLIQAGESLAYIRDQLGHHSIKVTVDVYGHLAPEGNKQAVDRLDDFSPKSQLSATQAQP